MEDAILRSPLCVSPFIQTKAKSGAYGQIVCFMHVETCMISFFLCNDRRAPDVYFYEYLFYIKIALAGKYDVFEEIIFRFSDGPILRQNLSFKFGIEKEHY